MTTLWPTLELVLTKYSLVTAFSLVGLIVWVSSTASAQLTCSRMHGSALAILIGLVLAYVGGVSTGGVNA